MTTEMLDNLKMLQTVEVKLLENFKSLAQCVWQFVVHSSQCCRFNFKGPVHKKSIYFPLKSNQWGSLNIKES